MNGWGKPGHMFWTDTAKQALAIAYALCRVDDPKVQEIAERGRAFVLEHHTYGNRMQTIMEAIG